MSTAYWVVIACGGLAILYGLYASRSVLGASAGNEKMQEIAGAIQEGAAAYLNRQYMTIGMVGVVVGIVIWALLGVLPAVGFVIGAVLSGAAGYIGSTSRFARTCERRMPPGPADCSLR